MIFQYYLPGVTRDKVDREFLRNSPLADRLWDLLRTQVLFQSRIVIHNVLAKGPDGSSGVIVAGLPSNVDTFQFHFGFYPQEQTWEQVGNPARYWIGFCHAKRPRPEGLKREHLVSGNECELGDGCVWVCPIVRRQGIASGLPGTWGTDLQTGEFVERMLPDYRQIWEDSKRILDASFSGDIQKGDALELCAKMLGTNYRIGMAEATILGLLDDTNWQRVWRSAIDAEFLERMMADDAEKKV